MPPIPLPIIPNVARCALNWVGNSGLTATNVIHIDHTALVPPASVMAILDAHVTPGMWDMVGSDWSVDHVSITLLDGATSTQDFTPATPAHWTGHTGGNLMPACAGLIKLTTASRGRAFRGRVYLPSPSEAQVDSGAFTDGTPITAGAAWQTFVDDLHTAAYPLVIASYDRAHRGAGATKTDVVVASGETMLATQRRRQSRLR